MQKNNLPGCNKCGLQSNNQWSACSQIKCPEPGFYFLRSYQHPDFLNSEKKSSLLLKVWLHLLITSEAHNPKVFSNASCKLIIKSFNTHDQVQLQEQPYFSGTNIVYFSLLSHSLIQEKFISDHSLQRIQFMGGCVQGRKQGGKILLAQTHKKQRKKRDKDEDQSTPFQVTPSMTHLQTSPTS